MHLLEARGLTRDNWPGESSSLFLPLPQNYGEQFISPINFFNNVWVGLLFFFKFSFQNS